MKPTLADRVLAITTFNVVVDDYIGMMRTLTWLQEHLKEVTPNILLAKPLTNTERFVFDDSPDDMVTDLVKAGKIKWKTVFEFARVPTDHMWFEHRYTDGVSFGAMVVVDETKVRIVLVAEHYGFCLKPVLALTMSLPPWSTETRANIHWCFDEHDRHAVANSATAFVACCLFLLNVPRLCEVKAVGNGGSRRNVVPHDYPPVEHKRVTIVIGRTRPVYEHADDHAVSADGHARRRFHHVVGFFRHYTKRRSTPKIVWINEQWRGDPKVGVIIRNGALGNRGGTCVARPYLGDGNVPRFEFTAVEDSTVDPFSILSLQVPQNGFGLDIQSGQDHG